MSNFRIIYLIVLSTVSLAAQAGNDSGFYLGASIGNAGTNFSDVAVDLDENAFAYKAFAGYNFGLLPTIDLAVESSYVDLGETSVNITDNAIVSTNSNAWNLFGLIGVNFGPVGLFAKAGMASWQTELGWIDLANDLSFEENDLPTERTGSDPVYGIGAKFQFSSFAVRAEYEIFDTGDIDFDMLSVGAAFTF
ncbi:Outer membrane protein beta-barrel domain-containing protein [Alteromonadaceae bacterium Bs31]|nr:Outer membrane protein beta-barrel domain-containing protein [Alteromonadaceae bacterium Bs31]